MTESPKWKREYLIEEIVELLDKHPIKSPLCFDQGEHECHDLADEIINLIHERDKKNAEYLIKHKIINHGREQFDSAENAIDQTLRNLGVE